MSPSAASFGITLGISGPLMTIRVETNFPAFKSGFYVAEVVASTPESTLVPLPKCSNGHERACRFESNDLTDVLDCDGVCHPGVYTVTVSVFTHADGTRLQQSPSYLGWVGGESGSKLQGHPLARPDPLYPDSTYLTKTITFQRAAYT